MAVAQATRSTQQGRGAASPNTQQLTDTAHAGRMLLGSRGFRGWDPLDHPLPTAALERSDFQSR